MASVNMKKINEIIERCKKNKIKLSDLPAIKKRTELRVSTKKHNILLMLIVFVALIVYNAGLFLDDGCTLAMPDIVTKALRYPENCDFCRNVNRVSRVENITPAEFEQVFAYDARPVIVTDAMKNWSAREKFDFWYFKEVYASVRSSKRKWNCQFFPYKTEFKSLHEALSMPEERVNYEPNQKPWYFGWSNCNREVGEILRQHYGRPYFLPETSENKATDWIFMGGPGLGAHMHVDNVRLPSWQAQVKGTKEWTMAPPPECYYECVPFKATVWVGDIIVLDTNKWYHMTRVLPGELSITIGAEYD